jgi:hypothetical protein
MSVNTRDPWGLLKKVVPSLHHRGLNATIIGYDQTGHERALCDCGKEYEHCKGAYKKDLRLESIGAEALFAQDGG